MSRMEFIRATCDRCAKVEEFPAEDSAWKNVVIVEPRSIDADLCPDCFAGLCQWLDGSDAAELPTNTRDQLLRDLWNDGMPGSQIAERLGVSAARVYQLANSLGLPSRKRGRKPDERANRVRPVGSQHRRHITPHSGRSAVLKPDHPAILNSRTLFPSTVVSPEESPRLLVGGHNQRKIGKAVTKGAWAGMPIYCLTLEERKTCPKSCEVWRECFAPETLVLCEDMIWRRIDELTVGERIVSFDEEPQSLGAHRRFNYSEVEALRRVERPRIKVITDRGDLTVTPDHLLLVRRKPSTVAGRKGWQWGEAGNLKPDDQISFLAEPWEQDLSYDAARVRGFVEGEGHVCLYSDNGFRKTRLGYAQRPGQLFDEINAAVQRLGFGIDIRQVQSGVNNSTVCHADINGGWKEAMRFLGKIRPTRLLENAKGLVDGHSVIGRGGLSARVIRVEPAPDGPVYQIATTAKTLIANGFLAHNCYGNNMHMARRHAHGAALEAKLLEELAALQEQHPNGFVVRLHILGDFYSLTYVALWLDAMHRFPALRIFGFTAHGLDTTMGEAILLLNLEHVTRCRIRYSGSIEGGGMGAVVIDKPDDQPSAVVCPAQTGKTDCCATCALCWTMNKPVAFLRHGEAMAAAQEEAENA